MNNESYVCYESFYKQVKRLEKAMGVEVAYKVRMAIEEFGLYGVLPDEDDEIWLYGFEQMISSICAAKDRYAASVENGKKGGCPKIELNRDQVMDAYRELKTWKAVSLKLGISTNTLKKARDAWSLEDAEKGINFEAEPVVKPEAKPEVKAEEPQVMKVPEYTLKYDKSKYTQNVFLNELMNQGLSRKQAEAEWKRIF